MSKKKLSNSVLLLSALTALAPNGAISSTLKTKKISTFPDTVQNIKPGEVIVKCAGIVKKGKNHCGANGHSCSGKASKDFDKNEWIYVRSEVCEATPGRVVGKKKAIKG